MVTQRLYYEDAYRTEFEAKVVASMPGKEGTARIILDRTCFYPTSGGQPNDKGTLDSQPVFDVSEQDGEIVHYISGQLHSTAVQGRVNWPRRFDHMQQHTGQHVLSQAFLRELNAQTVSFHLGEETSTIDLDRPTLELAECEAAENLANEVVFANRPVIARLVTRDELRAFDLRKLPTVQKDIRIVNVEGFEASPCGGTHVSRTGEVGHLAIRKWERRGQEMRVEFVCGWRSIRDYRWKTSAINELALAFSVKDQELSEAVLRLIQEATDTRRELHHLHDQLLAYEAAKLLDEAGTWNEVRVIVRSFEDRDAQEVRKLAAMLAENPKTIALLAASGAQARLVFGRSDDLSIDVAALLKQTCQQFGGGGGGQSHLAQGGGFPGDKVGQALGWAYQILTAR
jgi:alanyl-tRNA synthetase